MPEESKPDAERLAAGGIIVRYKGKGKGAGQRGSATNRPLKGFVDGKFMC